MNRKIVLERCRICGELDNEPVVQVGESPYSSTQTMGGNQSAPDGGCPIYVHVRHFA